MDFLPEQMPIRSKGADHQQESAIRSFRSVFVSCAFSAVAQDVVMVVKEN